MSSMMSNAYRQPVVAGGFRYFLGAAHNSAGRFCYAVRDRKRHDV